MGMKQPRTNTNCEQDGRKHPARQLALATPPHNYRSKNEGQIGQRIDRVAGLEARGFILGGAVAHQLSLGFLPIRKKGKLPAKTIAEDYELEYGTATVEIHDDSISPGEQILLVDDLLATGGTAEAGVKLIERLGGTVVGCAFVIDLPELGGRKRLEAMGLSVHTLCAFDGL